MLSFGHHCNLFLFGLTVLLSGFDVDSHLYLPLSESNSSPLKINGCEIIHFLLDQKANFQGLCSVSFRKGLAKLQYWLVVSTHLKNSSQIGSFPQVGVNIREHLKPPPRKPL